MPDLQPQQRFINNFDLLRILAASAVVFSHSYTLATGRWEADPTLDLLGLDLGRMAVDVFFVMSGFLVTGSLMRRDCLRDFWVARGLRIFPGIIVMLLLMVFLLGPLITTLNVGVYFSSPETWRYLLKNSTLLAGIELYLPGVFSGLPNPGYANGSLWSLPMELRIYVLLAAGWFLAGLLRGDKIANARKVFITIFLLGTVVALYFYISGRSGNHHPRLAGMFFSGAIARLYLAKIRWRGDIALAAVVLMALCVLLHRDWIQVVYTFCMPYCLLYIAHRRLPILSDLHFPDVSYGIYIYSFPLQQLCIMLWPGVQPLVLFFVTLPVIVIAASLSWFLVEKPAISMKKRILARSG